MTTTSVPPRPPHPPSADPPVPLNRRDAAALGERIQAQAAVVAAATCQFLLLLGDFDARGGVGWFVGLKSTAHWLSWACSMSPGAAREHVRVARALPSMPLTVTEFQAGRLSYSKVREISRVIDRVEEQTLVDMAQAMTASQLARTVSSFRAIDGTRLGQDTARQARWQVREDGMLEVRAVLPPEMGAEVLTALELALDRDGHQPPPTNHPGQADRPDHAAETGPTVEPEDMDPATEAAKVTTTATLNQRKADAMVALARTYLDATPSDRTGEDRHLVIIEVSADALPGTSSAAVDSVPAATPTPAASPTDTTNTTGGSGAVTPAPDRASASGGVPAGTSQRCGVLGAGPLEARTAERLACNGKIAVKVTDAGGEILYLGRSQRLASRAQRRALRLRDTTCVFPACHQTKHLDAHHITPWSHGGPTDIDALALLCRRHHVIVHEGGLHLAPNRERTTAHQPRFHVLNASRRPVQARWPTMLEHATVRETPTSKTCEQTTPEPATGHPDPTRIAATTGGAGFHLADCVDTLLDNILQLAA